MAKDSSKDSSGVTVKFKLIVKYSKAVTEVHEIELDDPDEIENFKDGLCHEQWSYTDGDTLIEKVEGDCLDSSLSCHVEEIQ